MQQLKAKLARLEQSVATLLPDQNSCPACRGRERLALSDEPENTGPPQPYDGPGGTCRLCRMPPPGTRILRLSAPLAEYFGTLPWAESAPHRFIEKLFLLKAIVQNDTAEAERAVRMLYDRDANGLRRWRWFDGSAATFSRSRAATIWRCSPPSGKWGCEG